MGTCSESTDIQVESGKAGGAGGATVGGTTGGATGGATGNTPKKPQPSKGDPL